MEPFQAAEANIAGDTVAPKPRPLGRVYKYYDLILAGFVTVLLCTNLISAPKRVQIGGYVFGAGVLFFPISYLFGDILTEVYGYKRSRKVVWAGFGALAFATLMSQVVLRMPADPSWGIGVRMEGSYVVPSGEPMTKSALKLSNQVVWETVFGGTWRVVLASMIGFFVGEFANSFTMAKMKIMTRGRHLWTRTIGSTVVGEMADSLLFYPIAFYGIWTNERLVSVLLMNYTLKVAWEVVATPLTYRIVGFLKKAEHEDYYDTDTDFTPFSLET